MRSTSFAQSVIHDVKGSHEKNAPPQEFTQPFFLEDLFHVTHDGRSERGTTRRLLI